MQASVVIPSHGRAELLRQVLTALSCQTLAATDYEIIVVDDGSPDKLADHVPESATCIRTEQRGAAAARNTGINAAKGDIIILLDNDILVDKNFIQDHCDYHKSRSNHVALGRRFHLDPEGCITRKSDTRERLLQHLKRPIGQLKHPWFFTYTCNVSLRREWAARQTFDEHFFHWGLEDSEWAYRLHQAGCSFDLIQGALGLHLYHERGLSATRFAGWRHNLDYTISKHPELRCLESFSAVFNPSLSADFFETYEKFESDQ